MKVNCAVNCAVNQSSTQCFVLLTGGNELVLNVHENNTTETIYSVNVVDAIVAVFGLCIHGDVIVVMVSNDWIGYLWANRHTNRTKPVMQKWKLLPSGETCVHLLMDYSIAVTTGGKLFLVAAGFALGAVLSEPVEIRQTSDLGAQSMTINDDMVTSMHSWRDKSDLVLVTRGMMTRKFTVRWYVLEVGHIRLIWSMAFTSARVCVECVDNKGGDRRVMVMASRGVLSVGSATSGIISQFDLLSAMEEGARDAISVTGLMVLRDCDSADGEIHLLVSCVGGRYFRVDLSEDLQSIKVAELRHRCTNSSELALPCCENMYLLRPVIVTEQPMYLLGFHSQFGVQSFCLDTGCSSLSMKVSPFNVSQRMAWDSRSDRIINIEHVVVTRYNPLNRLRPDRLLACCSSDALGLSVLYRLEPNSLCVVNSIEFLLAVDDMSSLRVLPAESCSSTHSRNNQLLVLSSQMERVSSLFVFDRKGLSGMRQVQSRAGWFVSDEITFAFFSLQEADTYLQVTPSQVVLFRCDGETVSGSSSLIFNAVMSSVFGNPLPRSTMRTADCSFSVDAVQDGGHSDVTVTGEEFQRLLGRVSTLPFCAERVAMVSNFCLLAIQGRLLLLMLLNLGDATPSPVVLSTKAMQLILTEGAVSCVSASSSFVVVAFWDSANIHIKQLTSNGELLLRTLHVVRGEETLLPHTPIRHMAVVVNANAGRILLTVVSADDLGRVAIHHVTLSEGKLPESILVCRFDIDGGLSVLKRSMSSRADEQRCRFVLSGKEAQYVLSNCVSGSDEWTCEPVYVDSSGAVDLFILNDGEEDSVGTNQLTVGWIDWSPIEQMAVFRVGSLPLNTCALRVDRNITVAGVVDQMVLCSTSGVVVSWVGSDGRRSLGMFDIHSLDCLWVQTLRLDDTAVVRVVGDMVPHLRVGGWSFQRMTVESPQVFSLVKLSGLRSDLPISLSVTSFALSKTSSTQQLQPSAHRVCRPIGTVSIPGASVSTASDFDNKRHWDSHATMVAPVGDHCMAVVMPHNRIVMVGWQTDGQDSQGGPLVASLGFLCDYSWMEESALIVDMAAASSDLLVVSAAQSGIHVLRAAMATDGTWTIEPLFCHCEVDSLFVRLQVTSRPLRTADGRDFSNSTDEDRILHVVAADSYNNNSGVLVMMRLVGKDAIGGSSSVVGLMCNGRPLDLSSVVSAQVVCRESRFDATHGNEAFEPSIDDFIFFDRYCQVLEVGPNST